MKKILFTILVIFFCNGVQVDAATAYVVVGQQSVAVGESVVVEWYLDTKGEAINIARGSILYTAQTLRLQSISTGSSSFTLWPEEPSVQKPGIISFTGGIPGGVEGNHILLFRTTFIATAPGATTVALNTPSEVLISNGVGTAVPISMTPVSFSIIPRQEKSLISSVTHPNQSNWSRRNDVTIVVDTETFEGYHYSFGSNPEIIPSIPLMRVHERIDFNDLVDGIYYFKLGLRNGDSQQEVATYRVLIDATAPEILSASVEKNTDAFGGAPFVSFYGTDKASGIALYKVRTGWFGFYHVATSPARIHRPVFGNVVHIKAIDGAGNSEITAVYYRGYLPNILSAILLIVCGGTLLWYIRFLWQKKSNAS